MADTQVIALAGKYYLMSQLLADGVEVATPARDRGIDLIAYVDLMEGSRQFFAIPIQLKTATGERFSLDRKYEKFPNLIIVFAWNISSDEKALYALTYEEGKKLLQSGTKGTDHTKTNSYQKANGGYSFKVNPAWLELLKPYKMGPGKWQKKILRVSKLKAVKQAEKE